jgi:hypothetical protein
VRSTVSAQVPVVEASAEAAMIWYLTPFELVQCLTSAVLFIAAVWIALTMIEHFLEDYLL